MGSDNGHSVPKCWVPALLLVASTTAGGCRETPHIEDANATALVQLNAIAANMSEADGRVSRGAPMTPNGAGQSMRASATTAPQGH